MVNGINQIINEGIDNNKNKITYKHHIIDFLFLLFYNTFILNINVIFNKIKFIKSIKIVITNIHYEKKKNHLYPHSITKNGLSVTKYTTIPMYKSLKKLEYV